MLVLLVQRSRGDPKLHAAVILLNYEHHFTGDRGAYFLGAGQDMSGGKVGHRKSLSPAIMFHFPFSITHLPDLEPRGLQSQGSLGTEEDIPKVQFLSWCGIYCVLSPWNISFDT